MEFILLLILLALSALFSGSETAFFSLGPAEIARLGSESAAGRRVGDMVRRPNDLLPALLIGNLIVNTAAGVVATSMCLHWFGPRGVAVAVPVLTLALLLFGEITPKLLALRSRRTLVLTLQRPLAWWMSINSPVLRLIGTTMNALLSVLPLDRTGSRPLTTSELQAACDLAVADGNLTDTEGRSLARLLQLSALEVQHVMTPRTSVVSLRRDMPLRQILAAARRAGYNRYPVVSQGVQRPAGLFHLKDLLAMDPVPDRPLSGELRPLLYVPETKDVAALLGDMRKGDAHLAAVVDEHGDFTGIVTMADCLQALLGPVADSTGSETGIITLGEGRWVVTGRTDLRDFEEACGLLLPASRDYVTVAGFMMTRLGRVLEPGDRIDLPSARLTVLEMTGHRVDRIQVTRRWNEAANPFPRSVP